MIIHVDDKGRTTGMPHVRARSTFKAVVDPRTTEPARHFTQDRETRICPRCMGLSTRENAAFHCAVCGDTGKIEVDTITELPGAPDAG